MRRRRPSGDGMWKPWSGKNRTTSPSECRPGTKPCVKLPSTHDSRNPRTTAESSIRQRAGDGGHGGHLLRLPVVEAAPQTRAQAAEPIINPESPRGGLGGLRLPRYRYFDDGLGAVGFVAGLGRVPMRAEATWPRVHTSRNTVVTAPDYRVSSCKWYKQDRPIRLQVELAQSLLGLSHRSRVQRSLRPTPERG